MFKILFQATVKQVQAFRKRDFWSWFNVGLILPSENLNTGHTFRKISNIEELGK
jgi:hypothetical protein